MKVIELKQVEIDVVLEQLCVNACKVVCMCEQMNLYPRESCDNCKYKQILKNIQEKLK